VCTGIAHFIDLSDEPTGIDEKRHSLRVTRVLFVSATLDAVRAAGVMVDVGQECETEVLVGRERLVLGGRIE
jgi:hypothetical protein